VPPRLTVVPDDGSDPAVPDELPVGSDDDGPSVAHDEAWFEELVRAHTPALHRYLVRRAGAGEADDLAADVLVVAWRRRDDVPDEAPLAWLYRTAGFVVANFRRKRRALPVGDVPDEADDDDDPAVRAVRDEMVRAVLLRLSPRDRQIVLLTAWEGLTGDELARVLGIGRGGADAALSRARARLAQAWAQLA
jgi:RNA polymerase sigma factor (sigma-70 family)